MIDVALIDSGLPRWDEDYRTWVEIMNFEPPFFSTLNSSPQIGTGKTGVTCVNQKTQNHESISEKNVLIFLQTSNFVVFFYENVSIFWPGRNAPVTSPR